MELTAFLQELDRDDIQRAGGKGANLGAMVRAGLPVPPGFVVLTGAYRTFLRENSLEEAIDRRLSGVDPRDQASLDKAERYIRSLFGNVPLPAFIREAVESAYLALGEGRVAVRSSATAEDLPEASFAGQQESYLNVEGQGEVVAAVVRCWSSLFTGRAIAYRINNGIPAAGVSGAVVVQRMVDSEVSGVLFTANPVSNHRFQVVVNASFGLGEAVVSGSVNPDQWVIDKRTRTVLQENIRRKEVMTVRSASGTSLVPVPAERQEAPSLDEARLMELLELGKRAESHFGAPQDLEWALKKGRLYLVQSRPITSLFPIPGPPPPEGAGLRVYASFNNIQGLFEPLTPMGVDVIKRVGGGIARLFGSRLDAGQGAPFFKTTGGLIYGDVTGALKTTLGRRFILGLGTLADRPMVAILEHLVRREEEALRIIRHRPPVHPSPSFVAGVLFRLFRALLAPDSARRRVLQKARSWAEEVEKEARNLTGLEERIAFVEAESRKVLVRLVENFVPLLVVGIGSRSLAERYLSRWLPGAAFSLGPVLRALPHNPTTQMDLRLWEISRELKERCEEPSPGHPLLREFLRVYGHRAVREIDVGVRRWREDPGHVIEVIRTYLGHGEDADPGEHFRTGELEAEAAARECVERVRREKGRLRAALMSFLLSRLRSLAGLREYPKFYMVKSVDVMRSVFLEAGRELAGEGRLEGPEDVFYLTIDALKQGGDLREAAARGRTAYRRQLERGSFPRVITSDGETFYRPPAAPGEGIRGTPASSGVFEGRVRVIRDPARASLEPGEVLVAPGTDPAWTPLFLSAGALVMEIGGIMSHGSVVAREYGIPAVVGVTGATEVLRTGQLVRVDGDSGRIEVLEGPPGNSIH